MKKIILLAMFSAMSMLAFAQKYVPVIKAGTAITFDAFSTALGQHIPLILTVSALGDPVKLHWEVSGYGTGDFEISAKAMESGTKLVIKQPDANGVTRMKDDQTLVTISKATFTNLVTNKAFELNGQKFTVAADTTVYKIDDKEADIFHAVSANGKSEIWVINNPDFPLVYKAVNIARGIDFALTAIKE